MNVTYRRRWTALLELFRAFHADRSGQIVLVFALSTGAIFAGLGAGVDLAKAFAARQRLSDVATLACQYSTRPSVAQTANSSYSGSNGFQTYVNAVNAYVTASLANQKWGWAAPKGGSSSPGSYFTATPAVGGNTPAANEPTNPAVEMNASIPTSFGRLLNLTSIPIHAKITCQTLAVAPQIVNPPTLLKEGFESSCASFCFSNPSGGSTTISTPTSSFPATAGYVGYNGFKWYVTGYCLEVDTVGIINPTVPEGTHAAELDCDNGSGSAGNSSISSSLYLEARTVRAALQLSLARRLPRLRSDLHLRVDGPRRRLGEQYERAQRIPSRGPAYQSDQRLSRRQRRGHERHGRIPSHPQDDRRNAVPRRVEPHRHVCLFPDVDRAQRPGQGHDAGLLLAELRRRRRQ